jgi:CRP/FNR family cyclic AMP-dependent transcriptional regulator
MSGSTDETPDPPGNFWATLEETQRRAVAAKATVRRFPPDTVLLREGDDSRWVLVLTSGRVKIVAAAPGGHHTVLAVRGPGDIIGELAAVDGKPRSATAITVDPVEALWLPADSFVHVLRDDPRIGDVLMRIITARLRYANTRRTEFTDLRSSNRIAALLVELAERYGVPTADGLLISLRIGQHDIAGLAAASREAVTRALRTLRDDGLISTGRQRITVHRLEALRRRAR